MFEELLESYGIFEEDGELFIENEMIEAVMDEFDLYEEDAIDLIMESFEEELTEFSEAIELLVEEYGYDEDEAIDLIGESYEEDLLSEGKKAVGGAALALGTAALAHRAYTHSKAPIAVGERRLRKAQEKLQFHKDTRAYMEAVEASKRRNGDENGYQAGSNNYEVAKSIARANRSSNRRIAAAQAGVDRAEKGLAKANARYDRVKQNRQNRKEKIKKGYEDYRQKRRDRKNPPQPEPPQPKRRFKVGKPNFRRNKD